MVTGTDILITAAGGEIGPFRFAVLYNETPAGEPLIGWWDYGSEITLHEPESFAVNFGAALFTLGS